MISLEEYVKLISEVDRCEVKKEFSNRRVSDIEKNFFSVGDTFTIPNEFSVLTKQIGDNEVEYIPISVKSKDGVERIAHLYPSTFWKCKFEVDEEGNMVDTRPVMMSGSVYDKIKNYTTVQSRMEALKGCTIRVSDAKVVRVLRLGSTETYFTNIYKYDII